MSRKKQKVAKRIKQKFNDIADLPKEISLDYSRMVLLGNKEFVIENYKGIVEYDNNIIRLNTLSGIISIEGNGLVINEISDDDVSVEGIIKLIGIEEKE